MYEANKAVHKLLCDGFILNREDRTQKDLYIVLIDYDNPENNIFKAVNQFEIEGVGGQLRIPRRHSVCQRHSRGGSGIQKRRQGKHNDHGRLQTAHRPLPQRYSELLKYNAFVVISDGANNKYGSLLVPTTISMRGGKLNLRTRSWTESTLLSR